MPTTLPDRAKRTKPQSWPSGAKLAPFIATFLYLLLLAWNVSAIEADFASITPIHAGDAYSPMEPAQGP